MSSVGGNSFSMSSVVELRLQSLNPSLFSIDCMELVERKMIVISRDLSDI